MDNLVTPDTILDWLQAQVAQKLPVDAHTWSDAAQKLNVLIGGLHDQLWDVQQIVAQERVDLIEQGKSVAEAKVRIEAGNPYKEMMKLKAKIGRIEEAIRISKIQSRLKDSELRNYQ